jgi:mRNA interferase MazF
MQIPRRGEVWLIDFGLVGKTRPALIVSVAFGNQDRALITVIPHTTSLRGSPFEIATPVSFLKPGAFLVQGVTLFPTVRAIHRLGKLPTEALLKVMVGLLYVGWDRLMPTQALSNRLARIPS